MFEPFRPDQGDYSRPEVHIRIIPCVICDTDQSLLDKNPVDTDANDTANSNSVTVGQKVFPISGGLRSRSCEAEAKIQAIGTK